MLREIFSWDFYNLQKFEGFQTYFDVKSVRDISKGLLMCVYTSVCCLIETLWQPFNKSKEKFVLQSCPKCFLNFLFKNSDVPFNDFVLKVFENISEFHCERHKRSAILIIFSMKQASQCSWTYLPLQSFRRILNKSEQNQHTNKTHFRFRPYFS